MSLQVCQSIPSSEYEGKYQDLWCRILRQRRWNWSRRQRIWTVMCRTPSWFAVPVSWLVLWVVGCCYVVCPRMLGFKAEGLICKENVEICYSLIKWYQYKIHEKTKFVTTFHIWTFTFRYTYPLKDLWLFSSDPALVLYSMLFFNDVFTALNSLLNITFCLLGEHESYGYDNSK